MLCDFKYFCILELMIFFELVILIVVKLKDKGVNEKMFIVIGKLVVEDLFF